MQTCQTCQFQSPLGAKFCRQCGAPLIAESELSGASTRNYGRQAPAFAPAGSAPLPPSIGDVLSSDTARYYQQPPMAPAAPNAFLTPSISTAPLQRKFKAWRYLSFLLVLMVGIGLGALFVEINSEDRVGDPVQQALQDAQTAEIDRQREMADYIREAQDRAREAQDRIREAQDHAREMAQQAVASGATIAPSDAKPLNLEPFEYPGAATGNYSRVPGSEIVEQRSKDSFDAIVQHYQKKLGKPLMMTNEDEEKKAYFQSTAAPAIFVSIESNDEHDGFWKITITRAHFQFPQLEVPPPPVTPVLPVPVKP